MSELASTAKAFSEYGPWAMVAALLLAVAVLYRRGNDLHDKLVAVLVKDAESDAAVKASLDKHAEATKDMAHSLDRLSEKIVTYVAGPRS